MTTPFIRCPDLMASWPELCLGLCGLKGLIPSNREFSVLPFQILCGSRQTASDNLRSVISIIVPIMRAGRPAHHCHLPRIRTFPLT